MAKYTEKVQKLRDLNQLHKISTYAVEGSEIMCSCGDYTAILFLKKSRAANVEGKTMLNVMDGVTDPSIIDFVKCEKKGKCKPKFSSPWFIRNPEMTNDVMLNEQKVLLHIAENVCDYGGEIAFVDDGQRIKRAYEPRLVEEIEISNQGGVK